MPATPTWALPYPAISDPANVPLDMQELCDRLEILLSQIGSIPGEVKLWSGSSLPAASYGKWVWADGASYATATYPIASGNINTAWKTFGGAADPGAGNFRVPDLRGLVPAGMDAMPGGTDAGRIARTTAIATRTGEENHVLVVGELASHAHTVNSHSHGGVTGNDSPDHTHSFQLYQNSGGNGPGVDANNYGGFNWTTGGANQRHAHSIPAEAPGTSSQGSGTAHENMQPTVWVPYIVRLDG